MLRSFIASVPNNKSCCYSPHVLLIDKFPLSMFERLLSFCQEAESGSAFFTQQLVHLTREEFYIIAPRQCLQGHHEVDVYIKEAVLLPHTTTHQTKFAATAGDKANTHFLIML